MLRNSPDELEQISTRTLALARYKRNHEFMHEVFNYAAFGMLFASSNPSISSRDCRVSNSDV